MPTETADRPEGLAINDNVSVLLPGGTARYYQIKNRDTIFYRDAHSALSAGGTESYAEITNLNPPANQLYQFFALQVDGNVKVYAKQPAATNRWGTNKSPEGGYLTDRTSPMSGFQLLNVWAMQDYPPNVQLKNDTNISITPILWWMGWRYSLEFLGEEANGKMTKGSKPVNYSVISVSGLTE